LHHDNAPFHTSFFTESLTKNNITVVTHTPYLLDSGLCNFSVSRHFDTTGRIAGGAQHPKRRRLPGCISKNGRSSGNSTYTQKGTILMVMLASRPKVFDWMAVPFLEIMDGSLHI
jgi:hypothetical protein